MESVFTQNSFVTNFKEAKVFGIMLCYRETVNKAGENKTGTKTTNKEKKEEQKVDSSYTRAGRRGWEGREGGGGQAQ